MKRRTFVGTAVGSAALLLSQKSWAAEAKPGAIVETASGKLRGLNLGKVQAFKGIRYGTDTSGAHRFMPAIAPAPWTGVQDAYDYGHESPQAHPHGEIPEVRATVLDHQVGEDCLRVNVWTPSTTTGKRPVMVWFHGGGFASGNGGYSIYDGANMARRNDVVMVTVNHRLNSFGFTYFDAQSSNVGMLDCVSALEWVRDNISRFGGDPANVTIFGQSGGGAKVSVLLAMPAAKGLFHKAIIQSGSYLTGVSKTDALRSTEVFLAKLGVKTRLEAQRLPMEQLIAATSTPGLRLTPVIDGLTLPSDPFATTAPAISANIPLIIGTTETEVTFFPNQPIDAIDDAQLLTRIKAAAGATDAQARTLADAYRKGRPAAPAIDLALIAESDARFRVPVMQQAELKSAQPAPVYMYYFTWRTPVHDGKLKSLHTLEIPFVTATVDDAPTMTGTGPDRHALETRMSTAWASFARTGNPSHKGLPAWPRFDPATRATMIFDNQCKVVNDPNSAERKALAALRRA